MAKKPEPSRKELEERARAGISAAKERLRLFQREIEKKQQLLRAAKAEESDDGN